MKYEPQLAKLPGKSQRTIPDHWIVERKWDGMRAIFEIGPDGVQIWSRTGKVDLTPRFPEFQDLHKVLRYSLPIILDSEIVCMDPTCEDTESLERLQMRSGDDKARFQKEYPCEVRFFDILEMDGEDTRLLTLRNRRKLLHLLLKGTHLRDPEDLEDVELPIPSHWEGVIAKNPDSTYASGKRNADWLKFKTTHRATLWAKGRTPGLGARASSFGAIIVEDETGRVRGQVGSGFPDTVLDEIMAMRVTDRGKYMEFDTEFLIEVEYRFLSKTGLMVNTAFKGIRIDKEEADVL